MLPLVMPVLGTGEQMRLFVGDDWAEDHHDVELMDEAGRTLARARLPEGIAGMARLHELIGAQLGDDDEAEVVVGTETDRGPWVAALTAAGYVVLAVNPLQAARFRDRHAVSGSLSEILCGGVVDRSVSAGHRGWPTTGRAR